MICLVYILWAKRVTTNTGLGVVGRGLQIREVGMRSLVLNWDSFAMCEGALGTVILAEEVLLKDEVLIFLVACGESVKVDSKEAVQYLNRPISGIK